MGQNTLFDTCVIYSISKITVSLPSFIINSDVSAIELI